MGEEAPVGKEGRGCRTQRRGGTCESGDRETEAQRWEWQSHAVGVMLCRGLRLQDVSGRALSRGAEGPGVNRIRHIVLWVE